MLSGGGRRAHGSAALGKRPELQGKDTEGAGGHLCPHLRSVPGRRKPSAHLRLLGKVQHQGWEVGSPESYHWKLRDSSTFPPRLHSLSLPAPDPDTSPCHGAPA